MTTPTHAHTAACWWHPDQARWVCTTAAGRVEDADGTASQGDDPPLVDVRDMLVVHTAMLREFRLAPAAVARVGAGAVKQAAVVDRHLGFLCDLLHHHHEGEDELLWPLLRERVPHVARAFVLEAEREHVAIDAALQAVALARRAWVDDAATASRDALVGELERLHALLAAHLDAEERSVLPLAAGVLTEAEWNAVGEAAAAALPKPALVLALGMFAYEGDPAVVRSMLASAPAVPRFLVPRIGPRVYARRARRVHGTSRP